ncbi:T9SS type A sorting domain-containing protein [Chryseobacterium sediminis]|uniref:T9SS type A sorting domain-containing protein n=1 Tax=Chryseobacterium sediminis TaxID=1679494 RepID=UPI00285EA340|nr:T9SS type A sorting domain-containing protein [Chryseobacterium sediminis]MDR6464862.1 hypothetical protein [Chryseobacterium sediminis]
MKKKLLKIFIFLFFISWFTGFAQSNVCFKRLHGGFAEIMIPVNQWNGNNVTLTAHGIAGGLALSPVTLNTVDLPKVTSANGTQYYYIKRTAAAPTEDLVFEVSSQSDPAISYTLPALPQDQWNTAGTADVCGVPKADVCFNRLHGGFAEILIPVNQWNGNSVTLTAYGIAGGLALSPVTLNTVDLPKVTSANGTQYYYIKRTAAAPTEDLVFEVSSQSDAAVSYTLPAIPQDQWNTAGTADVCGVPKADVCFNRLHGGFAEILIPVNQWNGNTVTVKAFGYGGGTALSPVTLNTVDLPKVTSANGTQYYYIKQTAAYPTEDLVFEVSSPSDAAVSYTLPAIPQDQWNAAGTADVCGVPKADVCFNRQHGGFAEILIPVNQWNGNTVIVRAFGYGGGTALSPITLNTASLPKVTSANGTQYYYIKQTAAYPFEDLVFEVSSPSDAAVSYTLPVLPQSEWNNFTLQNACINKASGVCINRNGQTYTIYIPKNNWSGTDVWVKLYYPNGGVLYNQTFTNPATEIYNGFLCYKLTVNYNAYTNENIIAEVSSQSNAALYMLLNPIQQLCNGNACPNPVIPTFTQIAAINQGGIFNLPIASNEGITGTWIPAPNNQTTTTYTFTPAPGQYAGNATLTVEVKSLDWTKAPNSYIFTGKDKEGNNVDGLYIPVKKAYEMWRNGNYMKGVDIPSGTVTADVLWEDNMGLIKSKENYTLDIIGSGEDAKIKVPVNKVKEGNALVAFKVNGEVFWSWHVWVTDDPTNGTTYKSYDDVKRQLSDGTVETIPNAEWGWMDRNLGAIGSSLNGEGWNRNGGLMYQWGRKDPFPPLTNRDASFYQVTGSIGKIIYNEAVPRFNFPNSFNYKNFNDLRLFINKSTANITDNIRTSVKNPLSLLYVNDDGTTNPSIYGTASNVPYYYNWFGQVPGLQTSDLSKVNLWSDNSLGVQATTDISVPQPYRNKSSYDPCPNGWRLPSLLVASSLKSMRIDFTPFGTKINSPLSALNTYQIPPGLSNLKTYLTGIKIYPQYGFDMSNVGGNNIGIFPGTGWIGNGISTDTRYHGKPEFTDQLETYLWTSTMTSFGGYSSIASALRLIPSSDQIVNNYRPDPTNYPNVYGFYNYRPAEDYPTNNAHACRCIKDPLFVKNNYNFETTFFSETETYKTGLDNPNTYMVTKSTADQTVSIPVSKAFSVQSNYLGNTQILNTTSFNDLKANVLWTDNPALVTQLTIDNTSSKDGNINVKVNANQSGNAVVTLHNGSISNPVYWSWHIWVTNTPVNSLTYANDDPIITDNYMNYTQQGTIMKTTIQDRNLGAIDVMPALYTQSAADIVQLNNSQGLHYQWGRKDPLPTFTNIAPNNTKFNVFSGTTNNGVVTYSTLTETTYNSTNIVDYNTYKSSINTADKIDVRIEKLLGYSVANPLKFMKPTVAYPTRSDVTYILGSDWLFDTNYHGLYDERWGLGTKKSVFDPCPDGWRIPETGTTPIKSSPWSLKNNPEFFTSGGRDGKIVDLTEEGYYGAVITHYPAGIISPYGNTVGFKFENSLYNVGYYPKGYMRGKRSVLNAGQLNGTIDALSASGIWYANLHQNLTGRGTFMSLDRFNRILVKYTDADPYVGMNCRCVKQEDNGTPRGPLPGIPVTANTGLQARTAFSKTAIEEKVKDDKLILYPNPVKDILYIEAKDDKDYYYQIYNMSGQLVKEGKFINKQTDVTSLLSGAYLVRINNSETIVKIIKK